MSLAVVCKSIDSKKFKRGKLIWYKFEQKSLSVGRKEYHALISDRRGFEQYISKEKFYEHCIELDNSFYIEWEYNKKIFIFNKRLRYYISFYLEHLSLDSIKQIYLDVFFYLNKIKEKTPEVLNSFETTITETLDKLKKASKVLDEEDFIKAVKSAKPVFEEMYNLSLSLCDDDAEVTEALMNEKNEYVKVFLEEFKKEMDIKSEVLKDLNNSSKVLDSISKLKK